MTLVAATVLLWCTLRWQGLNAVSDVIGIGSTLLPLAIGLVAWASSRHSAEDPSTGRTAEMDALMVAIARTMERVQYSADRLTRLESGLVEMRDLLAQATARLDDRKRALGRDLAARRPDGGTATASAAERARLEKEISALRQELADTRRRLRAAERLRGEVEQRLAEARRGQAETGELREQTRAQATQAERLLMASRALPAPVVPPTAALVAIEAADLLGEGDRAAAAKVLRRVDEALQENAATRDRLHDELAENAAAIRRRLDARAHAAPSGPGPRRRRSLPLLVGGCCSAVLLTVVVLMAFLRPPGAVRPLASGPATAGTPEVAVSVDPAFYPRAVPAWKKPFSSSADIASAITVWRGTVYFGGNDGRLHALDVDTGKSVWPESPRLRGDITARPAIADGTRTLYVVSNKGFYSEVSARDATTGGEVWTSRFPGYIDESAVVAGDTVYFGAGDGLLYALNAADGRIRWTFRTGGWITSTPVVADDVVYFGSWDGHVYAVDTRTRQAKWSTYVPFKWTATIGNVLFNPALANGVLYIGDKNYDLLALNIADGSIRWRMPTKDIVDSRPVVADGVVYVGSRDHNVYAFDAATGRLIWKRLTGNAVFSSPAVRDGVVYVGSNDAYVYAFDAADGRVLWVHGTGNSVYSSPAVSDGVVYVGSDDNKLYALKAAR
ncbi:hypothetical protein Ssi03_67700 [Sphaerisporangium siamense]|nr:hypothetical protein Ssi03_67700 [Sphaerisporangium siamense]